MLSKLDTIMANRGIPAILRWRGIPATHTIAATGDEIAVTVIVQVEAVPVGEYGERMEMQTTLQIPASSGAVVGDTFTVDGTATEDDPYPDDVIWKAVQLLSDDGTFRKFVVQK
ncbi:MAG: hypothetical protein H6974_12890 [Gammaproteobacteria bacterium]|nr:hypothetical protein [Gammaproteobacteria bacterium]